MTVDRYALYGVPNWGSVLAEAMLTLSGAPFDFVDVDGFDHPGPGRDRLLALNPIAQVPTLVLPSGEVMTESVAIALYLSELYPEAGLAPPPGSPERPRFLRWLVWIVANVYPMITLSDYPERFAPEAAATLKGRAEQRLEQLWAMFEDALRPGPWCLGETFSALDIFACVMVRWGPRPAWFAEHAPELYAAARRADALDALRPVWIRNFGEPL